MRYPRGRCGAPGSLGRHVLGAPDWAGRQVCDCRAVRRLPAGTHGLPVGDPWVGLHALLADVRAGLAVRA